MTSAHSDEQPRFEPTDASGPAIALSGLALLLGLGAVLGAAAAWQAGHGTPLVAPRAATSFRDSFRWQAPIARDWAAQDALVRSHLDGYGWMDREHGVVRIPVERAMERIAAEAGEEKR